MQNRPPSRSDPEVLSEPLASRLLARASELDAVRGAGSAVVDLRAAAAEAGISAFAFDAALAELQDHGKASLPDVRETPRRRSRMWALTVAVAALVTAYSLARSQPAPAGDAAVPGAPIVEEVILLRCLSPGEAAELVRPLLRLRSNSVVYSPAHAPRVLKIRATPAQLQNVKSLLEKYEGAGAPSCAPRPTATVTG
jgi:hypothetical protein